jgi:hypothetical protein
MSSFASHRRCVCLLLTATLLAPGTLPLGLAHAHPGANRPHHHHDDEVGLGAPGDDVPYDDCHRPEPPGPVIESTSTPHVHLSWFGLELTIPGASGTGHAGDGDQGGTIIAPARGQDMADARAGETLPSLIPLLIDLSLPTWVGRPPSAPPSRPAPTPNASPPLCDSARHERSGVQLG